MSCQCHAKLGQVTRTDPLQGLDRLDHLKGIADRITQGCVHICDKRAHPLARMLPNLHHRPRQLNRIIGGLHKRTASAFDVQHDAVVVRRELFAHDARCDQRNTVHRGGHVAQGVQQLIGRRKIGTLPHDRQPYLVDRGFQLFGGKVGAKALDGFQFIDRAARMSKSPAAHFGDLDAKTGNDRRDHKAGLVANPARGMLIHAQSVHGGKRQTVAAIPHSKRERGGLLGVHAAKPDRHAKCRRLIIGDTPLGIALNEKFDLGLTKYAAVSLFLDDIVHTHEKNSPFYNNDPSIGVQGKGKRQKITQGADRLMRPISEDHTEVGSAKLRHDLPANTAGSAKRVGGFPLPTCHGDRRKASRTLAHRLEERRALCTVGGRIGRVFDITARKDLSVSRQQSRADAKARIGCVGVFSRFDRQIHQFKIGHFGSPFFNSGNRLSPQIRPVSTPR